MFYTGSPKSNFIAQIPIILQAHNAKMSQKDMEAAMIDIVTKNVKQIGTPSEEDRIYICDEAYRRIHTTSFEEKRVFVFMGHTENYNGKYATFIEATIPVASIEFRQGLPVWNSKTWSSVFAEIKRKYEEMIIVGWALDCKGYAPKMTPELEFIHKEQFGGVHQVFMISDSIENEEDFYINKGRHLAKKTGFFIYYKAKEKREAPRVEIELPDDMGETQTAERTEHISGFTGSRGSYRATMSRQGRKYRGSGKFAGYALTAAVAALVVAFGISVINGREKVYSNVNSVEAVNNMEDAINLMRSAETETQTEETEATGEDTTETMAIPVEEVQGEISGN